MLGAFRSTGGRQQVEHMTRFAVPFGLLALAIALVLACPRTMTAAGAPTFVADGPNPVAFPAQEAKFGLRKSKPVSSHSAIPDTPIS